MSANYYRDLIEAGLRELINLKAWVVGLFVVISFVILTLGLFWPKSYETSALLHADVSNIIAPLLRGRAEVTDINQSQHAKESIYTRRLLLKVAERANLINEDTPVDRQEGIINGLRSGIQVKNEAKNYFRLTYKHPKPGVSYETLNHVVNVFIEDASLRKREESYNAFTFIDAQVKSYKEQLEAAEQRLKEFQAGNLDGTESGVASRISQLRTDIEEQKLDMEETEARRRSVEQQLQSESKYQATRGKVDEIRDRMSTLQAQLDALRLNYKDTYPDIVSIKDQIAGLELEISIIQEREGIVQGGREQAENPLYEELRKQLSTTDVDLRTQRRRLQSLNRLLEEEYDRAGRVAAKQAELTDLTRDYDVTRQVYEEMLERKESARLSMTLDVEGQGVTYKLQEPAVFPLVPSGLRFLHFVIAGPIIGLLLPLGLVVAYVMLDPRIRSASLLMSQFKSDIEVLGVIPHINTPFAKRVLKGDVVFLGAICFLTILVYSGVVFARLMGAL
ncbi:chain length-determining protein [Exilibacterium tricleocarpae]|uniref:Chain length-determining protein n=1 Tax=Exilibacterium tricleocarpae TaxID=2591008 RepID=A0A545T3I3_9GAMM|nr:XrtA system polysaccharide chain length determinant [Exilibacterium tricleocarpae]TQV71777.1 chain length-determining protein [Exilibacterium tricleocarpae]